MRMNAVVKPIINNKNFMSHIIKTDSSYKHNKYNIMAEFVGIMGTKEELFSSHLSYMSVILVPLTLPIYNKFNIQTMNDNMTISNIKNLTQFGK
jgi:hypothetical protein